MAAERVPLIDAARNADKEALRALLKEGVDVNAAEADGTTALHWASYRDDLESADLLIRAGAKVNAANDLGATPLWTASLNGSAAMVRRLLQAGANPNLALLLGETPLMVASRSGNPDVVEQLIAKGANVNARGARGQTALMWAVAQQHAEVVKVLLASGADIHARIGRLEPDDGGAAARAARVQPRDPARGRHGADVCRPRRRSRVRRSCSWLPAPTSTTRMRGASARRCWRRTRGIAELVEFLLDKGADANSSARRALRRSTRRSCAATSRMVTALLAHGADPNAPLRTWTPERRSSADFNFAPALVGATPFWLAARFNEPHVMRLLVKHGADPLVRAPHRVLRERPATTGGRRRRRR